jgi:hypothetical protein
MSESVRLRAACAKCSHEGGYIVTKGGQDVMRCAECHAYQYCAPRLETGRAVRTLASRPDVAPSRRWRILEQHGHTCVACHRSGVELQLAHLISRDDAEHHGFLDEIIDSDHNIAPMCAECNSGQRPHGSVAVTLMYRILVVKAKKAGH